MEEQNQQTQTQPNKPKQNKEVFLTGVIVISLAAVLVGAFFVARYTNTNSQVVDENVEEEKAEIFTTNPFEDIRISARSAYVKDINTGEVLYSKNPKDIATLFEYVLKYEPELFEATTDDTATVISTNGINHNIENTNEIINELPNVIASKTGFTDVAGGNLAVIIDPGLNRPVVIVVMGSSKDGRFKDVERLSSATLEYFATQ
jgi:D-alanyl-D-alanine carboxypeptidase